MEKNKVSEYTLFNKFNTKTSFIEDICYVHLSKGIDCTCQKGSLGRVKMLAKFFESIKENKIVKNNDNKKEKSIESKRDVNGIITKISKKQSLKKNSVHFEAKNTSHIKFIDAEKSYSEYLDCKGVSVIEKIRFFEEFTRQK